MESQDSREFWKIPSMTPMEICDGEWGLGGRVYLTAYLTPFTTP